MAPLAPVEMATGSGSGGVKAPPRAVQTSSGGAWTYGDDIRCSRFKPTQRLHSGFSCAGIIPIGASSFTRSWSDGSTHDGKP
jgi:hypothetical protein